MKKLSIATHVLLVLLLAFATWSPSLAQVKSSAITGTVTDQSGAVVPNAAITVTEQETNTTTNSQSDSKGEYTVPYLPIGKYTVSVTAEGFQTYRQTDITLGGNTTFRANVPLTVGSTATTVDVTANALTVQTETATVSYGVDAKTIVNLANPNGNSLYFATLESGVQGTPQQQSSTALGVGYAARRDMSGIRINGGMIGSNDVQLDGISIQGAAWHETAVLPNPDALAEVRVITNNFSADTGLAQGVISQTTKNGTNEFHGDLNFLLRNEAFNANTFGNNRQGIRRPTFRLFQGGGAIGGPVIIPKLYNGKDKLFFFASFLRLTYTASRTFQATVPTLLERTGDFSQTSVANNSGTPTLVNIYNPFAATAVAGSTSQFQRTQYAGNKVTNPSAFGLKLLQGYPAPNATAAGGPSVANGGGQDAYHTNNFTNFILSPTVRNSFNSRVDFKPRDNQSIFFSFGISNGSITNPNNWGNLANGPWVNQPGQGDVVDKNPYGAIGDTIVISPTTVVDLRYGVTHINTKAQVRTASGDPSLYGQPGFVAAAAPFGANVLPGVPAIGRFTALNSNSYGNKQEHQLNHFATGSLTKIKGKLTMKVGAEYRVYLQNWQDIQWQSPPITTTNYTAQYGAANGATVTALTPLVENQGFAPASVAAGVEGFQMDPGTAPKTAITSKYFAVYMQNTFHPTPKWVLTAGLRYDIQPGPTERYNKMSSFVLDRTNPFATGATINPLGNNGYLTFPGVDGYSRNLYNTSYTEVAPRFGFTYQANPNTVVRGGYGRNYLPSNTGFNANTTIYNPVPFDTAVNAIPYGLSPNGKPAGTFDQASNTYVVPGPGAVQAGANYGGTGSVTIFNRNDYKTGHTDQWNVFIEQQLTPSWITNIGYVGSHSGTLPWRGFPLNGPFTVNPATLAGWRQSWLASNGATDPAQTRVANPMTGLIGKAPGESGSATITQLELNEPYLALLNVTNFVSVGSSNYHALQLKVQHSASHGLQFGANYSWSKATGLVGNSGTQTFAESQQGNSSGPTGGVDYFNFQNNHSVLDYDITHRLAVNGSYALPFGKGKYFGSNRFVNVIIGDWSATTALTLQSGFPFGPNCAQQTNSSTSGTLNGRCNRVAGQPIELPSADQHYYNGVQTLTLPSGRVVTPPVNTFMHFNPDAFSTPTVTFANGKSAQDQYSLGTTPLSYSNIRTPGIQTLNLSVIKRFPITERTNLEIHADGTNVLNHTNHTFTSNSGVTANNTVGAVTTAAAASNTAVGANTNVAFGSYGLSTLEARQVTFQAKFTF